MPVQVRNLLMSVRSTGGFNNLDDFKAEVVVISGYVMMMNYVKLLSKLNVPLCKLQPHYI